MLRVGTPVVLFDLTDGSQIALNSVDAIEWRARDPKRYSLSATGDEMGKQVGPQPQAITGTLVNANPWGAFAGGCWLVFDLVLNRTFIVDETSAREWIGRDQRYSRTFP
jgi:hypothetical protein